MKRFARACGPAALLFACGEPASGPVVSPAAPTPVVTSTPPTLVASPAATPADTPDQIYQRVYPDLVGCYEQGRKETPTMTSGRATLGVSVDPAGKPACVIVSEDTGLTQEVEDCMAARMAREIYAKTGAAWTTEIAVVVKSARVTLGPPPTAAPAMDMVETQGLPESAFEVVESLLPALRQCVNAGSDPKSGLHVMHVGARVAKDGRVECALASSHTPLPPKLRDCSASVLANAKFPPPRAKSGVGLVSVPLQIFAK